MWRDNLKPGSFRGVPFLFDDARTSFGRRTAIHEYPLRDKPYPEDLGRKYFQYNLDVYVLGPDNYMPKRDALIAALVKGGRGPLVHPLFGTVQVKVTDAQQVSESTREGGIARFSLSFVEDGPLPVQAAAAASGAATTSAASSAQAASQAGFVAAFASGPSFVQLAAVADLNDALGQIQAIGAGLISDATALWSWGQSVASIAGIGLEIFAGVSGYAASIGALVARLSFLALPYAAGSTPGWASQIALAGQRPAGSLTASQVDAARLAQLALARIAPSDPSLAPATPDLQIQADNQVALFALIAQAALIEASQAAVAMSFDSQDQAIAVRDALAQALDAAALATEDEATAQALDALRVAMVNDITAEAINLPLLITVTPPQTVPAVALAHRIYDDPSWDADIVSRNGVLHPLFVAGGQPLKVLSP